MLRGDASPWGEIQISNELCPGVYSVSTAGHGGVMVKWEAATALLSRAARREGFRENGFLCYEEDCAAAIPLRELVGAGKIRCPPRFTLEEYKRHLDDAIREYFPRYYAVTHRNISRGQTTLEI